MHHNSVCNQCYHSWLAHSWLQTYWKCYGEKLPNTFWLEDNGWWRCYLHIWLKPHLGWPQLLVTLCGWPCGCCHGLNSHYYFQQPLHPPQWGTTTFHCSVSVSSVSSFTFPLVVASWLKLLSYYFFANSGDSTRPQWLLHKRQADASDHRIQPFRRGTYPENATVIFIVTFLHWNPFVSLFLRVCALNANKC